MSGTQRTVPGNARRWDGSVGVARAGLVLLSATLIVAAFAGGVAAERAFAAAVLAFPVCVAGVVPVARGARGRVALLLAALVWAETVGFVAILTGSAGTAGELPPSTRWMTIGLGLVPLVVLPFVFARSMRQAGPTDGGAGEVEE